MDYKQKYLKYKTKYLDLKGGKHKFGVSNIVNIKEPANDKQYNITEVSPDGLSYTMVEKDNRGRGKFLAEEDIIGKCSFKVGDTVYIKERLRVFNVKDKVFNIKGQLRGLSREEIRTKSAYIVAVDQYIDIPVNDEVSVVEVLFKDSEIPLLVGMSQNECYRIKVKHGTMELIINSNNLKSQNDLQRLPVEVNCMIYQDEKFTWRDLVNLSDTDSSIADDIRKCQFDFYDQEPMTFAIFRRYFPCAVGLNLSGDYRLVDANFREFLAGFESPAIGKSPAVRRAKGIIRLNMSECMQAGITNAAFDNLRGIHTLNMRLCSQAGITNAAFDNLRGIHTLDMWGCDQVGITDTAFVNLRGIHTLVIWDCNQLGITDVAFNNLRGINTLNMRHCRQITNAAFVNLRGIHTLDMSRCGQVGITDAAFNNLRGIHTLDMVGCNQAGITNAAFDNLRGIHTLYMNGCNQVEITDVAFCNLRGIHTLNMSRCSQAGITNAAFDNLRGIHILDMSGCRQVGITDAAFTNLRGIHTLNMSWCDQAGITNAAFANLRGIHTLDMSGCEQVGIYAIDNLIGIHILNMYGCRRHVISEARGQGLNVVERDYIFAGM